MKYMNIDLQAILADEQLQLLPYTLLCDIADELEIQNHVGYICRGSGLESRSMSHPESRSLRTGGSPVTSTRVDANYCEPSNVAAPLLCILSNDMTATKELLHHPQADVVPLLVVLVFWVCITLLEDIIH
jgi:hypothetical protein